MLPKAPESWTLEEAAHLLNRAGFGACPDEIRKWHQMGRQQAVQKLLSPPESSSAALPDWVGSDAANSARMSRREKLRELAVRSRGLSAKEAEAMRRKTLQELQRENRRLLEDARQWWIRRMIEGKHPLLEKMTLFWHDHFASSAQKVRDAHLMVMQNQLFRQHAFGNFKQLVGAVVRDPAMMLYLDTQNSNKTKPNENFAREVMELFTLGVGNYSEQDVAEAARAFTGYRFDRVSGEVRHIPRQWDNGEKTLWGESGKFNADDVVNMIFKQAAAATLVTRKIWEYFVYENAPDSGIAALAKLLRDSNYEIRTLLQEVFLSREFYSEKAMRSQIKSPVQFLVTMVKQLEIDEPPARFIRDAQEQLGQQLFMPPNVAGWDWGKAWINTNTLLTRYNLAGFLTQGAKPDADSGNKQKMSSMPAQRGGAIAQRVLRSWDGPDYEKIAPRSLRENPEQLVDALCFRFFQGSVPDRARTSFLAYAEAKKGVVFTNTEVAQLCHLMLSTPYYQLC
ncbi:MAG: DUF1800 domain-containing protein [Luteolibacter sp.]